MNDSLKIALYIENVKIGNDMYFVSVAFNTLIEYKCFIAILEECFQSYLDVFRGCVR